MILKYIFFDFDGVICNSYPVSKKIFSEYAKKQSFLKDLKFEQIRQIGVKNSLMKLNFINKIRALLILKKIQKKHSKELYSSELIRGMKELIIELSKKYELGILSSNEKNNIIKFLSNNNMLEYFKIITTEPSLFGKDKVMKKILKKNNINSNKIIYIGDEDRDVISMKKLNLKIISVTWGHNSKEHLEEYSPDFIADYPKDILRIISNL